jgi:tartrate dehydratase alpha subunit/fumarate hydratase class I-like protein
MAENKTVRSITGRQTTAGAAEETLNLSLDGAAPAATIAVGTGTTLTISDWVVTALAAANFRFQQTNDGITFFDIFMLRVAADGTVGVSPFGVGLVVTGGTTVAVRVRVESPGGAIAVTTSIRGYTAP